MDIKYHFYAADANLVMANEKLDRSDYVGARASLARAYFHTGKILYHVGKLEVSKANLDISDEVDGT